MGTSSSNIVQAAEHRMTDASAADAARMPMDPRIGRRPALLGVKCVIIARLGTISQAYAEVAVEATPSATRHASVRCRISASRSTLPLLKS